MAYKRIYAPNGEPFDISESRANDLILQKGWTQQPPVSTNSGSDKEPEFVGEDPSEDTEAAPKRRRKKSDYKTAE